MKRYSVLYRRDEALHAWFRTGLVGLKHAGSERALVVGAYSI